MFRLGDHVGFLGGRPAEFGGHDVGDAGEGLVSGAGVEEGETGAAGENVGGGDGVFVLDGIADLRFDDWEGGLGLS